MAKVSQDLANHLSSPGSLVLSKTLQNMSSEWEYIDDDKWRLYMRMILFWERLPITSGKKKKSKREFAKVLLEASKNKQNGLFLSDRDVLHNIAISIDFNG